MHSQPIPHSRLYLRSNRVFDANHCDAGEVRDNIGLIFPVWHRVSGEFPVSDADRAEAFTGHWLNHFLHHLIFVSGLKSACLSVTGQDVRASDMKREPFLFTINFLQPCFRSWPNAYFDSYLLKHSTYFLSKISDAPLLYKRKLPSGI